MTIHLKHGRTRGMAVLVVIVLLAVILTLVLAAGHSLVHLKSELKHMEREQTNRLAHTVISPPAP